MPRAWWRGREFLDRYRASVFQNKEVPDIHYITMWTQLTLLNYTCENGYEGKFYFVFTIYTHKGDQTKIISLSKLWKFKIQKFTDFKDSNLTTGKSLPKKKNLPNPRRSVLEEFKRARPKITWNKKGQIDQKVQIVVLFLILPISFLKSLTSCTLLNLRTLLSWANKWGAGFKLWNKPNFILK